MDRYYLILNISNVWWSFPRFSDATIPPDSRPSYIHTDKEKAEKELMRLQVKNPHAEFILFESIAETGSFKTLNNQTAFRILNIHADGR